jgi:integrase
VCGPALEAAVLEGKLVRNVARLVKSPEHTPRERETWSKAEVRKFLGKASPDRLSVAWRRRFMACAAVRCSACAGRISICGPGRSVNQARVLVEYRVCIEEPKSRNGKRTLPLYAELVTALTVLHRRQLEESTIAGEAYGSGVDELDWYQGGEYVITDAVGTPVHPQWYSDEFNRLLRRAGLRRITLHDSRHTTLTLMEMSGVASAASFSSSCERRLPAEQRAALEQPRSHRSPYTLRDLGRHHPHASSRTMMQPVRLQRIPE